MAVQHSLCAEEVRRQDWDRFICSLFAPAETREALYVLLAFNLEVAKTREVVSEPLLGEIRLQWWRDAIAGIYDAGQEQVTGHYILENLPAVVRRFDLSRAYFDRIIDARGGDLSNDHHADTPALLAYGADTSASLNLLMLEVLREPDDGSVTDRWMAVCDAARDVGIAWSLIGLVRAVPLLAGQGRTPFPLSVLKDHDLATKDAMIPGADFGAARAVEQLCDIAMTHVRAAREQRPAAAKRFRSVLLPAVLTDGYYRQLKTAGFNPYNLGPDSGRLMRQLRVGVRALRGGY